jgi:hypothetical protein
VKDEKIKEMIRNYYYSLINDINFIKRLKDFEDDAEDFIYIREKL